MSSAATEKARQDAGQRVGMSLLAEPGLEVEIKLALEMMAASGDRVVGMISALAFMGLAVAYEERANLSEKLRESAKHN